MVQYSEAIYNIIRKKIQDIDDVTNYKTISETLSSNTVQFDDKVNQLYTYLKNEGISISKIKTLIPNQNLLQVLNNCYKDLDNISIANINQEVIKSVTEYYRNNTDIDNDINIARLQNSDNTQVITDDEYNNIINSLNILKKEKTLFNILIFIFTCGFNNLYKSLLDDKYSEFNIINKWYNELINPKNIANINKTDIIKIYNDLDVDPTLKSIYDDLVKLKKYTNTDLELNYNKSIEENKDITSVFINSKWTLDKNNNILSPSTKTVNSFLSFFDNDDNIDKITSDDVFNSWNIQLMTIYNNIVNMQSYISFFIKLNELKDDNEFKEFILNQEGFNDNTIKFPENANILYTFKNKKINDKQTVEQFITDIISNYKNGELLLEQDFQNDVQLLKNTLISIINETENPNDILEFVKESLNEQFNIVENKKVVSETYQKLYDVISNNVIIFSGVNKNPSNTITDKITIGEHIINELEMFLNNRFKRTEDNKIKIINEKNSFFNSFKLLISNNDNEISKFFTQFNNIDGIKKTDFYTGILSYFSDPEHQLYLSVFYTIAFTLNKFN